MRRACFKQRGLVGEVAIDGRTLDAGLLGDAADRGPRRADAAVELDRGLGDALTRLPLLLGPATLPVLAGSAFLKFSSHICTANIDRALPRVC